MINRLNTISTRQAADLLLAAVFVAITQLEVWVFTMGGSEPSHPGIGTLVGASIFGAIASGALAWRRSRPALSFWINAAGVIGIISVGLPGDIYQWTNLIAIYSVGAYGRGPQRWIALPASLAGVGFYFFRFPEEGRLVFAAFVMTVWVAGWLAGRIYGARLDENQLRHEMDLSRQLVEENEKRLALEEERVRIARELHDIIGHTVNVMVVYAGAGRRAVGDDESEVSQVFDTIESTGRKALGELDRVLALLRRDDIDPEVEPTPGLDDLKTLASLFTDTGLMVDVIAVTGNSAAPASVELTAYRIIQEALTNTLVHGDASRAVVTVESVRGTLDLSVADDGQGDPPTFEPGRGITGMRERAGVHGGTLTIDRAEIGGIEVRVTLNWEGDQ